MWLRRLIANAHGTLVVVAVCVIQILVEKDEDVPVTFPRRVLVSQSLGIELQQLFAYIEAFELFWRCRHCGFFWLIANTKKSTCLGRVPHTIDGSARWVVTILLFVRVDTCEVHDGKELS